MHNTGLLADSRAIAQTADVLGVSPLRIFELAYQEWHGRPATASQTETAFVAYLLDGVVPCWVRAFTRSTLHLCEEAGMREGLTQSGQDLTRLVSPAQMLMAMLGLGVMCLTWLTRHL